MGFILLFDIFQTLSRFSRLFASFCVFLQLDGTDEG